MADIELDTSGLTCPLPVLKAKKAIRDLAAGGTLAVISTDPGSVEDFEVFCEVTGHVLLEQTAADGRYHFLIRRKD
ncbi:MAG: sulfurtransferase TusA family protein [Hyphomicrobiaceae bacterium]